MRVPVESSINLSKALAQWIDRSTIAWNIATSSRQRFALEYAPDASLRVHNGRASA
jgi:Pullulanase N2 domain